MSLIIFFCGLKDNPSNSSAFEQTDGNSCPTQNNRLLISTANNFVLANDGQTCNRLKSVFIFLNFILTYLRVSNTQYC